MLYAIAMVCILILDQALKYWTILNITPVTGSHELIPGVIELLNHHNTGAAFGILEDGRWFFIILTAVAAVAIIVVLARDIVTGKLARFSLLAVLAGGLGNCIDRIMNGYVVDMFHLQFMEFAVFNVADIFVTVFGIIFCICLISGKAVDKEEVIAVLPGTAKPSERKPNVDYITQLRKPVVEGKEAIENELAARKAQDPTTIQHPDDGFGAWNIPEDIAPPAPAKQPEPFIDPFADTGKRPAAPAPLTAPNFAAQRPAAPAPMGQAPVRPSAPAPAVPDAKTTPFDDPFKEAAKAAPKSGDDFNLEDIIAEFKD